MQTSPSSAASPAAMRTASYLTLSCSIADIISITMKASYANAWAASSTSSPSSRSSLPPMGGLGAACGGSALRRGDCLESLHHTHIERGQACLPPEGGGGQEEDRSFLPPSRGTAKPRPTGANAPPNAGGVKRRPRTCPPPPRGVKRQPAGSSSPSP